MKNFMFFLAAMLLLASCKQVQFVSDEDVYNFKDPVALRPSNDDLTPEASLEGFSENQENNSRSSFYDPQNDLNQSSTFFASDCNCNGWNNNSWGNYNYGYNSFGSNSFGSMGMNPWAYNHWGYNPWGMNSWGINSWGINSWGINSWGNSWGYNPWGYYGYWNPYGPWGYHGGMGWNPYGYGGWTNFSLLNPNFQGVGGSGFVNNTSTHFGPRPNLSSSYNPNNMNVGSGNVSPIGSNGQPINNGTAVNADRGINRQDPVAQNPSRSNPNNKQTLTSNSSPWDARVIPNGAPNGSERSVNQAGPSRISTSSGNTRGTNSRQNDSASRNRPAQSTYPSSSNSRTTYPSSSSSSGSRSTNPSSGASRDSGGGSFGGGSSSSGRSSGSSGGSSSGSAGGGRSGGSSGGSSGGGRRP